MKKALSHPDAHWARDLVLLAKNTYVWLDQLSHKYGKRIMRLDQIPEAEIADIASRGVTGLWLVGIWQRSPTSRKIKHLCGRPDALASAYSLLSYRTAEELGGEDALVVFREKLAARNLQLACDMVPNHTGMDAAWLFQHPDRYLTIPENPDARFSFDTPNLSDNPADEIYIEKGYYDQSGAAEVFKLVLTKTGEVRYVYHGNDGTSMPWNDTAQLNYLNPATRQALLDEIVKIARKFSIIRLDAAMTLTRKHFKRLWFPSPGSGQFIPTRNHFRMTAQEFDQQMPHEFWEEVIRELSKKSPHTLLIAEAFWLTEHFFINEIGMHRVYNSAFMHQLRDEQNREYRSYLKSILRTDPAMLERFVNFLTTPDEQPAILQFGKSTKYLGACRLLACLPGLPMFGHGQWEGLKEHYGMDIASPAMREEADQKLMSAHERFIRPLLRRRAEFSSAASLRMYDLVQSDGLVNENVFAFSQSSRENSWLILFNNSAAPARGKINTNTAQKMNNGGSGRAEALPLWRNLRLPTAAEIRLLEALDGNQPEKETRVDISSGLALRLGPYESRVYRVSPF